MVPAKHSSKHITTPKMPNHAKLPTAIPNKQLTAKTTENPDFKSAAAGEGYIPETEADLVATDASSAAPQAERPKASPPTEKLGRKLRRKDEIVNALNAGMRASAKLGHSAPRKRCAAAE
jgi:hypothetical protein